MSRKPWTAPKLTRIEIDDTNGETMDENAPQDEASPAPRYPAEEARRLADTTTHVQRDGEEG